MAEVLDFVEGWPVAGQTIEAATARSLELGCEPISTGAGAALRVLTAAAAAKSVVEVGTGAGVSGLWLLGGMRADGVLTSVDVEAEHQRAAREAFTEAATAPGRFRLINGSAGELLPRLTDAAYDIVFIDADPASNLLYFEQGLRLLRPGGVLIFARVLAGGRVSDATTRDPEALSSRSLLNAVRADERLLPSLLPLGDGLLAAVTGG